MTDYKIIEPGYKFLLVKDGKSKIATFKEWIRCNAPDYNDSETRHNYKIDLAYFQALRYMDAGFRKMYGAYDFDSWKNNHE
jgi:hypothetical protein